ncbi:MAG: hypothetical protein FWD64_12425 [Acidobacteriaceae bacterium]|nr:hypothetical protein [Acidobacteriaceae bacterium]
MLNHIIEDQLSDIREGVEDNQPEILLSIANWHRYRQSDAEAASEFLLTMDDVRSMHVRIGDFIRATEQLNHDEGRGSYKLLGIIHI